jgi:hypothetical protein
MAIKGTGQEFDLTMKAGASVCTVTSEFLCVGAGDTTTSTDWTAYVTNDSTTAGTANAYNVLGINQTRAMSSNSDYCSVRMFGISKAICAHSIQAFSWVGAYRGVSTTTRRGQIEMLGFAETQTANITATNFTILGRALESGDTNSVISIFVNPVPYPLNHVTQSAT